MIVVRRSFFFSKKKFLCRESLLTIRENELNFFAWLVRTCFDLTNEKNLKNFLLLVVNKT